jgi:3-hydroxymyristoyl/3-hydroxydecanoyl-(acyl carrier protein) dehydratase
LVIAVQPALHFSAFSFVDRITGLEPGRRAHGRFLIPPASQGFLPSLAAEAVGQLAAWLAMAQSDFRRRPVAGIAGEVHLLAAARPGDTLDLHVEIASCDDEAVAYGGRAEVGGTAILALADCVGPMLPLEEFDAPEAVADRFALLCGTGAPPGRFPGVAPLEYVVTGREPGRRLQAELRAPGSAPYFADHFPRRPVVPGSLLLDAQLRLAAALAGESAGPARPQPCRVQNVKLRAFIPPEEPVEIWAEMPRDPGGTLGVGARLNGRPVSSGRVQMTAEEGA